MQKKFKIILLASIFLLGSISMVNAEPQVIDRLEIVAIKKIKVNERGGNFFLDMDTIIKNSSEQETRLRKGNFMFSMSSIDKDANPPIVVVEKKKIGTDKNHADIILKTGDISDGQTENPLKSGTVPNGENEVKFNVNIGRSPKQAFENLKQIINCIGSPPVKSRINILGTFELGVLSNKGWSMVENTKIEWIFDPEIQSDKVNFMTLGK